ncbi:MAG: hypothetical protein HLUCCA11_08100 [Phormidesmis priestleyi Ana]|uniref:Uncharacterized protein n=1 Tax=Phormidesmis priestleyi Ana TaxID=1666911 RepID=A0A0P7YZV5_9CYAN|nr:MAG: hypothetical protein HLUCCA11_08100 [Phormidesmis priestleyi Ana]
MEGVQRKDQVKDSFIVNFLMDLCVCLSHLPLLFKGMSVIQTGFSTFSEVAEN